MESEYSGQNQHFPKKSSKLPETDSESLGNSQKSRASVSTRRKRRETDVLTENEDGDTIAEESLPPVRKRPLPKKRHRLKRNAVAVEKKRRLSPMISDSPEDPDHHADGQTASLDESEGNGPITDEELNLVLEQNFPDHAQAEKTATQAGEEALLQAHCINSWSFDLTGEDQSDQNLQDTGCSDGMLAELEELKSDNAALHSIVPHLRQKILDLSIERDKLRDQIATMLKPAAYTRKKSTQTDNIEQDEQRIYDLERQLRDATSKSTQEFQALERQLREREDESEQRILALTMQLSEERNKTNRRSHDSQMQLVEVSKEADQRIHDLQTQLSERTKLSENITIDHERALASHQQEKELNQGLIRKLKERLITYRKQQQQLQASCNEMKDQLIGLETIKQKNQSIKEENRKLAWVVYHSQRQIEKSREDFNKSTERIDNIIIVLSGFISEVEEKGTAPLIERIRTLQKEISTACESSSSYEADPDASMTKLETLELEKQAIFQIVGQLRPGIVTTYNNVLCLDMDALKDEIATIRRTAWELCNVEIDNSKTPQKTQQTDISYLRPNALALINQHFQNAQRLKAYEEEIPRLRHEIQNLHNLEANRGEQHRACKEEISTLRSSLAFFKRQRNAPKEPLGGFGMLIPTKTPWTNDGGLGLGINSSSEQTTLLSPLSLQNTRRPNLRPDGRLVEGPVQQKPVPGFGGQCLLTDS